MTAAWWQRHNLSSGLQQTPLLIIACGNAVKVSVHRLGCYDNSKETVFLYSSVYKLALLWSAWKEYWTDREFFGFRRFERVVHCGYGVTQYSPDIRVYLQVYQVLAARTACLYIIKKIPSHMYIIHSKDRDHVV